MNRSMKAAAKMYIDFIVADAKKYKEEEINEHELRESLLKVFEAFVFFNTNK